MNQKLTFNKLWRAVLKALEGRTRAVVCSTMIKTNEKNNQFSASPWRRLVPCSLCSYWVSHDLLDGSDIVLGSFHDLFIVSYRFLFVFQNFPIEHQCIEPTNSGKRTKHI